MNAWQYLKLTVLWSLIWWIHFNICDAYLESCGLDLSNFMAILVYYLNPVHKMAAGIFLLLLDFYLLKTTKISQAKRALVYCLFGFTLVIYPFIELMSLISPK